VEAIVRNCVWSRMVSLKCNEAVIREGVKSVSGSKQSNVPVSEGVSGAGSPCAKKNSEVCSADNAVGVQV
jgi:hypothetical protein